MSVRELGPASLAVAQAVALSVADVSGPLLVGVSGGADSLALAFGVARGMRRFPIVPTAIVVDHQLQSGSAEVAAEAVATCLGWGLDARTVAVDVVASRAGLEADARDARRAALEAADQTAPILLGHTLDDQAETVLLGLARGSGTRSLAAMAPIAGRYRRPLLGLRRQTTVACCRELGLSPWTDPHNGDPRFTRVRVREEVLPLMESALGPGIAEALARTASMARDDADALDAWAASIPAPEILPVAVVEELPTAVASRVIRRWLRERGAATCTHAHVAAVMALVTAWKGQGPLHLPGVQVQRVDGHLAAHIAG